MKPNQWKPMSFVSALLKRLQPKQRRGSKPRCHFITHGTPDDIASRLTGLAGPWGQVTPQDCWMPQGFDDVEEAQLHMADRLLPRPLQREMISWWLAVAGDTPRTPNWDIASTCTIGGKKGLLLVEAKAHDNELIKEEAGKKHSVNDPADDQSNYLKIGLVMEEANRAMGDQTKLAWNLSRDRNYQMSNRFAWSWKLTEYGIPVVLVYLGFLNAKEMADRGKLFETFSDWDTLVRTHSEPLFPGSIWNHELKLHGQTFVPLVRAIEFPLGPK